MPEQQEYPTVQGCQGATARSSLDLLALPYPFSQVGLLNARDFASEANRRQSRGWQRLSSIDTEILEELHRCGILVPLFRVDLAPLPDFAERAIDLSESQTAKQVTSTVINELLCAAAEGRAFDPATEVFAPWPQEPRRVLWPSVDSGYVYSRHQLLGLDVAVPFVSDLKPRREGHSVTWHLDDADLPNQPTREALTSWRGLAITLAALDTYYWPQITHTVRHDLAAWRAALEAFEPTQMLTWLCTSLDEITRQAGTLKSWASMRDNAGDFYEMIRRAKAESWDSLRGDTATAMDYRLAADILDRYAEDQNPGSNYAGGRDTPLSQQGLSARPESLDAALTDLRLSPFPALVIGVEGETEYRLVPRVMELLGIRVDRNWIQVIDFGGTGDLKLLARYAGEPVLGRELSSGVALDRPLTRFLVLADAENKFKEAADKRKQRRLLLESLTKNVPLDLRSDYYINTRRDRIVEIRTWGKLPFEFAHFKDSELADAMLAIARVPHPRGRSVLISNLRAQRTRSAPDVSKVFWGRQSGLTKPALADALWTVLEARINRAIRDGKKGPPIMQACTRAYEMAVVSYGVKMMLRRRRWRPRK